MATTAPCLFCFEVLSASLEKREPLNLSQVEELWAAYQLSEEGSKVSETLETAEDDDDDDDDDDEEDHEDDLDKVQAEEEDSEPSSSTLRLPSVSRLQASSPFSASTPSTPSTLSATSSQAALGDTSKSSSNSSFFSFARRSQQASPMPPKKEEEHPLFVTWNTVSSRGHKSLRGCIGTFEPQELESGLKSYALTSCVPYPPTFQPSTPTSPIPTPPHTNPSPFPSAFDDTRFAPITSSELPHLSNSITLLQNFTPCADALDWDLGRHGLRLSFTYHHKRLGATYLPDVAVEQGWTKEETVVSLMRKAGWTGRSSEWKKVEGLRAVRYQGLKASVGWGVWREWRDWVGGVGV